MFYNCPALQEIDISGFDASTANSLENMFYGCQSMRRITMPSGENAFNNQLVTTMEGMFQGCFNLESVDLSSFSNGPALTNVKNMFSDCRSLSSLNLGGFEFSSVQDMSGFLYGCSNLVTLDLQGFNGPEVQSMADMFHGCIALTTIYWPASMNTNKLTNISGMFNSCYAMNEIDLTALQTQNVTDMSHIFSNCTTLRTVDLSTWTWNTSTGVKVTEMFSDDTALVSVFVGSGFSTAAIKGGGATYPNVFKDCLNIMGSDGTRYADVRDPSATYMRVGDGYLSARKMVSGSVYWSVDNAGNLLLEPINGTSGTLATFATTSNTLEGTAPWFGVRGNIKTFAIKAGTTVGMERNGSLANMFKDCNQLTSCNLAGLDATMAASLKGMFQGCTRLSQISNLTSMKTTNILSMREMFSGCSALRSIDLGSFEVQKVTDMASMFLNCSTLESIVYPRSYNTSNVTDMSRMYEGCYSLRDIDMGSFNTANVTDLSAMFKNCRTITSVGMNSFNVQKVSDMREMFSGCLALQTIDVSSFNAPLVTSMKEMFYNCQNLENLVGPTSLHTTSLTNINMMFAHCYSLKNIDLTALVVTSVTDMGMLFEQDRQLVSVDLSTWQLNPSGTDASVSCSNMFSNCLYLTTVYVSEQWDYKKLIGANLFTNCRRLVGANGVAWSADRDSTWARYNDASQGYFSAKATKGTVRWTLAGDGNLVLSPVSGFSGEFTTFGTDETTTYIPWYVVRNNVRTFRIADNATISVGRGAAMASMFRDCVNMTSCDLRGLDTSNSTSGFRMFYNCQSLQSLDLSGFRTSNMLSMKEMFSGCRRLTTIGQLNFSLFDTTNVRYMDRMFYNCQNLSAFDASGLRTGSCLEHVQHVLQLHPTERAQPDQLRLQQGAVHRLHVLWLHHPGHYQHARRGEPGHLRHHGKHVRRLLHRALGQPDRPAHVHRDHHAEHVPLLPQPGTHRVPLPAVHERADQHRRHVPRLLPAYRRRPFQHRRRPRQRHVRHVQRLQQPCDRRLRRLDAEQGRQGEHAEHVLQLPPPGDRVRRQRLGLQPHTDRGRQRRHADVLQLHSNQGCVGQDLHRQRRRLHRRGQRHGGRLPVGQVREQHRVLVDRRQRQP